MRKIKQAKINKSPSVELALTLLDNESKKELDSLEYDNKEKATLIIGSIVLALTTFMDGIDDKKEYFINLDYSKITTIRKLVNTLLTNCKNDYKKGIPINEQRKKDLHDFAKDNNISQEKENELINEVDNLSPKDLINAKDYGFWCMNNIEEMKKDHPNDIYFYQYACCRWLAYILEKDILEMETTLKVVNTLSDKELKATNHFIKHSLLSFIEKVRTTDLQAELYNLLENREK